VTAHPERLWLPGVAAVAVVAVALDQVTKSWAVATLTDRDPIHVVGTLQLALSFNSGIAFSLGTGSGLTIVPLALAVVLVVLFVARSLPGRLAATAVGLVVGGAIGNLADRLFRSHDGAVVDFLDLQWWPVFNVADACIVVGGALLALCSLRRPEPEREPDAVVEAEGPAASAPAPPGPTGRP
jgi:signal peptidase II